jgi:hypothetical protein
VEIFDHPIRWHDLTSPCQPAQQVHVDQTTACLRRYVALPPVEVDALLQKLFQLINVWRPISHAASD